MKKFIFLPCLLSAAITAAFISGIVFLLTQNTTTLKPSPVKQILTTQEAHRNYSFKTTDKSGTMKGYTGFYFGDGDGVVLNGSKDNVFVDLSNFETYVYTPADNKVTFQKDGLTYVCTMASIEPQDNTGEVIVWQDENVSKYCIPTCLNEAGDTFLVATEVENAATDDQYLVIQSVLSKISQSLTLCTGDASVIDIAGVSIPVSDISAVSPDYIQFDAGGGTSYLAVEPIDSKAQDRLYEIYDQYVGGPLQMRYSDSMTDSGTGYQSYVFCLNNLRFTLYAQSKDIATQLANEFSAA